MQYLLLALILSEMSAAPDAVGMTCQEVREIADTVIDSELSSDDKLWILDGLIKNHGSGCGIVYEDAKAN